MGNGCQYRRGWREWGTGVNIVRDGMSGERVSI